MHFPFEALAMIFVDYRSGSLSVNGYGCGAAGSCADRLQDRDALGVKTDAGKQVSNAGRQDSCGSRVQRLSWA